MKTKITHDVYGEIVYDENFWSGKKQISIDGKVLTKSKRNIYVYKDLNTSLTAVVKGNALFGVKMTINNSAEIAMIEPPKWYETVIAICILCIGLVLGNLQFVVIVPVVGGAIGGAVSGAMAILTLSIIKPIPKIAVKIGIGIALFALTFLFCHILALMFLAALA